MTVWLQFLFCLVAIALAGSSLSRYGDVIAEKTGLSGTWIGILLLATVTSIPELVTGLSSVVLADSPDIAIGSLFGSCVFNLAILVLLDFIHRRESIYRLVGNEMVLTASLSLILIGVSTLSLWLSQMSLPSLWHFDYSTVLIAALYLWSMRMIFLSERRKERSSTKTANQYDDISLRRSLLLYGTASMVVISVGVWLPFVGRDLAASMGWQETFVGNLLIALATSLPEVVVTYSAARMGALDMAVGNIFGSNLFNMLVVAIDDLAYLPGPLLAQVSSANLVSGIFAIVMSSLAVTGLLLGSGTRPFRMGWISGLLALCYFVNAYLIFQLGG